MKRMKGKKKKEGRKKPIVYVIKEGILHSRYLYLSYYKNT